MKEKLIIEIFIMYYLTLYTQFIIAREELARYYLLAISVRSRIEIGRI